MRSALIVGIDHYDGQNKLLGCVKNAENMKDVLTHNHDDSNNFDVNLLTSNPSNNVTAKELEENIKKLFATESDVLLFYFAGHSYYSKDHSCAYFYTQDAIGNHYGVPYTFLMNLANKAYPKHKSVIIIIDSCHAGSFGEECAIDGDSVPTNIGTGVNILLSAGKGESAKDSNIEGSFFTRMLVDGLRGSAADIRGNVTPAALYSHIDHLLSSWDQRPIFKANVNSFVSLRRCKEKLSLKILLALPKLFENPDDEFPLDFTFEPDRENVPERYRHIPVNPINAEKFKILQRCNRFGLVVPIDAEHMYYAAINSKSCKLTELGKHYRFLAKKKRLA